MSTAVSLDVLQPSFVTQYSGDIATAGPCAPCYFSLRPNVFSTSFYLTTITIEINEVTRTVLNGTDSVQTLTTVAGTPLSPGSDISDVLTVDPSVSTYTRAEDLTWVEAGLTFTWPTIYYRYDNLILASGQTPRLDTPAGTDFAKWPSTISNPFVVASTTCTSAFPSQIYDTPVPTIGGSIWYNQTSGSMDPALTNGDVLPTGILESMGSLPLVQSQLSTALLTDCLTFTWKWPQQTCAAIWNYCTAFRTFGTSASTTCTGSVLGCSSMEASISERPRSGTASPPPQAPATLLITKQPVIREAPNGVGGGEAALPGIPSGIGISQFRTGGLAGIDSVMTPVISAPPLLPTGLISSVTNSPLNAVQDQPFDHPVMTQESVAQSLLPIKTNVPQEAGDISRAHSSTMVLPLDSITGLTLTRSTSLTFSRSSTDIRVNGQSLAPGSVTTLDGQTISKLSDGNGIVIGSSTILLQDGSATTLGVAAATERLPVSKIGSALVIGSSTLLPGSTIVYDGQTLSLDTKGSTAFINGTPIPAPQGHADAKMMSALFPGRAGALLNNAQRGAATNQPEAADAKVTANTGVAPSGQGESAIGTTHPLLSNEATESQICAVLAIVLGSFMILIHAL